MTKYISKKGQNTGISKILNEVKNMLKITALVIYCLKYNKLTSI